MIERIHMSVIHFDLSTPIAGMMSIGKMRATRIPDIMIVVIWLNTERPPLSVPFRVESGTMRLWLILKIVYAKE